MAAIARSGCVSPASVESLTRGLEVFNLCKRGNVESLERLLGNNPALIHQKDEQGNGLSYYAVESSSLTMCRLIYEKNVDLFSSSNPVGRSAFKKALSMGNDRVVDWFLRKDEKLLLERDENGDSPIIWASKAGLLRVVELILAKHSRLIFERDGATGGNLFLIVCGLGDLGLAQRIYKENAYVVNFRDKFGETPLLKAFKSPNGIVVVKWLFSVLKERITCEEEVGYFIKAIPSLERSVVTRVLRESAPANFICYFREIRSLVRNPRDRANLEALAKELPAEFDYRGQGTVHLTGRSLIEYYNVVIEDIPAIKDPCNRLMAIFYQLTEEDYLVNMNLGRQGELAAPSEAAKRRERELSLCHQFIIEAIDQEKPDKSIPKGAEVFYYIHLKRIFKHLVRYLEQSKYKKDETFSYLSMITKVSGTCYTNYSTLCHNMYGALAEDPSLVEAASQEDQPAVQFFNEMTAFYKRKIQGKALRVFQGLDAHVVSVIQRFFDQSNIPYFGEVAPFDELNELPALLTIRKDILRIVETQDDLGFYTELDLYDQTRDAVVLKFKEEVNSIKVIYEGLKEFLLFKLNGSDSPRFLEALNEWLTEKGISTAAVLEYDEENKSYALNNSGVCEMLKKFPRKIVL